MSKLSSELQVGALELSHRILVDFAASINSLHAAHGRIKDLSTYLTGSIGSLVITEAVPISRTGKAYPTPSDLRSPFSAVAWREITKALHDRDTMVIMRIGHAGAASHSSVTGGDPVGPCATALATSVVAADWSLVPSEIPRALRQEEISEIVEQYSAAADLAMTVGFDGVELDCSGGFLLNQFLCDGTNFRTDLYGGGSEDRARLLFEVLKGLIDVWGYDRVGVRISPLGRQNGVWDSNPRGLFHWLAHALHDREIAYLHLADLDAATNWPGKLDELFTEIRSAFPGVLFASGGFTVQIAEEVIRARRADAIGIWPLSQEEDLPEWLREIA